MLKRTAALSALVLLVFACGEGPLTGPDRTPTSLQLDRADVVLFEGESERLVASVLDQAGEAFAQVPSWGAITWSSSDSSIVRVTDATIEALLPGTVTIRARTAGQAASAEVEVRPVVAALEPTHEGVTLLETALLSAPVRALDSRGDTVPRGSLRYVSSDPEVLAIRENGVLEGVRPGQATVRIETLENGPGSPLSLEVPVRVRARVTEFTVTPDSMRAIVGDTFRIEYEARDTRGDLVEDAAIQLRPNISALATVDEDGLVTLLDAGLVRFTASVLDNGFGGSHTRSIPVHVNPPTLSSRITSARITQGVQRQDGTVPLVADRPGFLRVSVESSSRNFFRTDVTVHLRSEEGPPATWVMEGLEGYPTQPVETNLGTTWNVMIPDSLVRPGLQVRVEIDPWEDYPLLPDDPLVHPADGGWLDFEVREAPPLHVKFIPVHQSRFQSTPNFTDANRLEFMGTLMARFPMSHLESEIGSTFSTSADDNGTTDWLRILAEIRSLRLLNEDLGRHYYGLVQNHGTPYGGYGYIGHPVGVGVETSSPIFVHELGHNFGRLHAPCGDPAGVDPAFPYADGRTGGYGYDLRFGIVWGPDMGDVMSYCHPQWTSDYTYEAVMDFREARAVNLAGAALPGETGAPEPGLLVTGRIRADEVQVEPALVVDARPATPRGGPHRLEGIDADGAVLFSFEFDGEEVAAHGPPETHFAFVLPEGVARPDRLVEIRVRANGMEGRRTLTAGGLLTRPELSVESVSAEEVRIRWDADLHPLVLVRDDAGEILSFARGGDARVRTRAATLLFDVSDGTRSTRLEPMRVR